LSYFVSLPPHKASRISLSLTLPERGGNSREAAFKLTLPPLPNRGGDGGEAERGVLKLSSMRSIHFIILHCSGTKCDRRFTFNQCRNDHIYNRHRTDIGYHYYVELDGSIHRGRPEEEVGAHCKNRNLFSIGVCYEGGLSRIGYPADTRTPAQKEALLELLTNLHRRYPNALIVGHRDLSRDRNGDGQITPEEFIKSCPCLDTMLEYEDIEPRDWEIPAMR